MAEVLINDFHTALTAQLLASAGVGSTIAVSPGAPAAYVGSDTRLRVGQEVIVAAVSTAASWTVVQRAAEDADRFPAATHPSGSAVAAVLTAGGLAAVVGGAGFARTNAANTFTAAQTVVAAGAAVTPLVVKGASGQTANLQEWQNSGGTALSYIDPAGGFNANPGSVSVPWFTGRRATGGSVAFTISERVSAAHTVIATDGQPIHFTTNPGKVAFDSTTGIEVHRISKAYQNAGELLVNGQSVTLPYFQFQALAAQTDGGAVVGIITPNATAKPLWVRGAAGQTANLQEWQDSSGTALLAVKPGGQFSGALPVTIDSPTMDGTRHGDIIRYRRSTGESCVLLRDDPLNSFTMGGLHIVTANNVFCTQVQTDTIVASGSWTGPTIRPVTFQANSVDSNKHTHVLAKCVGAVGQTGNLQEWQSSAGTALSTVSENGYFTTRKSTAPADAELSNGELAFWYDEANAKFKIKAKNSSGTVVTGEVALS